MFPRAFGVVLRATSVADSIDSLSAICDSLPIGQFFWSFFERQQAMDIPSAIKNGYASVWSFAGWPHRVKLEYETWKTVLPLTAGALLCQIVWLVTFIVTFILIVNYNVDVTRWLVGTILAVLAVALIVYIAITRKVNRIHQTQTAERKGSAP